jgi:Di-haem cytochrome c peroxidase
MYRFGVRPLLLAFTVVICLHGAGVTGTEWTLRLPLGLQEQAAYIPDDNPLTPEKIALGKQLFWDKRWSRNGTVACVSCLSSAVKPLGLTAEERASLVAFLEALTGEVAPDVTSPPRLPE